MQLSLLSDQFSVEEQNTAFTEAIKSSKTNNTPLTGTLQIGGILRNKISAYESGYYSPDTATRFWINLDANNLLARSAFVPAQTRRAIGMSFLAPLFALGAYHISGNQCAVAKFRRDM